MLNFIFKKELETKIKFPNSSYFYFGLFTVYLLVMLWIESKVYLWILSMVCVFILVSYTYLKQKLYRSTYTWIDVNGSLKKINIEKSFCSMHESFSSKKNLYEIVVEYTYKYDEHKFISNTYALGQPCNYHYNYKEVKEIVKKMRKNENTLQIKVNPKKPTESVIIPGVQAEYAPSYVFILLIYGGMFLFVPFIL